MKTIAYLSYLPVFLATLAACTAAPSAPNSTLQVLAKQSYAVCPIRVPLNTKPVDRASIALLTDADAWIKLTADDAVQFSDARAWRLKQPNQAIVVASSASKPSGGYRIDMLQSSFDSKTGTVQIEVKEMSPPANQPNTSMMTKPCLLLHIQVDGLKNATLLDEKGHVLSSTP
jgi:hypothetical protein